MRNIAIFSGASNTFGLGLEIEFRDKYNDDKWLKENGMMLPLPREPEDVPFWKEHRWTKLVSDELGLEEYNIHDAFIHESHPLGGNAIETLWMLHKKDPKLKKTLENTKYIFLEISSLRWWDEFLHGSGDGKEYPNTILEIIDLVNNKDSNNGTVAKALEWVENLDERIYWEQSFKKYKDFKNEYPHIEFVFVPWHEGIPKNIIDSFKSEFVDVGKYVGIFGYLKTNNLTVGDFAKAYNGNYKYNRKDDHPSKLGHRHVANFVINHINKNKNLETIPFKIRKNII
jgi:hypothetical protein